MIAEIRIDDALWSTAPAKRRDDWRVSIADLLEGASLGPPEARALRLSADTDAVVCEALDAGGAVVARFCARAPELRPHVREYLRVMRKLHDDDGGAPHSARYAAFDMAKKVVHDAAAKTLAGAMPGLAPDHETYRRLFSLFFSLVVDVTRIPGATAHRRHG